MGIHYNFNVLYSSPITGVGEVIGSGKKAYVFLKAKNAITQYAPVHMSQASGVDYGVACTAAGQKFGLKAGAAMVTTVTNNFFFAQCWGPFTSTRGATGSLGTLTSGIGYSDTGGNQRWGSVALTGTASLAGRMTKMGEVFKVPATAAASATYFLTCMNAGKV